MLPEWAVRNYGFGQNELIYHIRWNISSNLRNLKFSIILHLTRCHGPWSLYHPLNNAQTILSTSDIYVNYIISRLLNPFQRMGRRSNKISASNRIYCCNLCMTNNTSSVKNIYYSTTYKKNVQTLIYSTGQTSNTLILTLLLVFIIIILFFSFN